MVGSERGLDPAERSVPMSAAERDALGTLRSVTELCQSCFGERFVAGYAMGSLARGGFSPLVSDVDFGLILSGPLSSVDHRTVDEVQATAVHRQWTLADRLSIFWGSRESLRGEALGGRFPAFDRLDLLDHATLLAGQESRTGLPRPALEILEVEGFEFALDYLATPSRIAEFHAPRNIIVQGPLHLSKTVLYPPRFLFTSATGQVAGNDSATEYYLTHFEGPDAELVADTFRWRSRNEAPADEGKTLVLLEHGLLPLYAVFLRRYRHRMQVHGRPDLVIRATEWARLLGLEVG